MTTPRYRERERFSFDSEKGNVPPRRMTARQVFLFAVLVFMVVASTVAAIIQSQQLVNLTNQDTGRQETVSALETEKSRIEATSTAQHVEGLKLQETVAAFQANNESLQATVTALQAENASLRATVMSLQSENVGLRSTITVLESEILRLKATPTVAP